MSKPETVLGLPAEDVDALGQMILDLLVAIKNVPAEAAEWWRAGHRRTEWIMAWEDGDCADGNLSYTHIFYAHDEKSLSSWEDYKMWNALGWVSDLVVLTIAALVVALIVMAV